MKKTFTTAILCATAATMAFAGPTDREVALALDRLIWKNSPRYQVFDHEKIVEDYQAFAKTNALTDPQKMLYNRMLAVSAVELEDQTLYSNIVAEIRGCTNAQLRVGTLCVMINKFTGRYSTPRKWKMAAAEFDADPGFFGPIERMALNCDIAGSCQWTHDKEEYLKRVRMIAEETPAKAEDREDPKSLFSLRRARSLCWALNAGLLFALEETEPLFEKYKGAFDEQQIDSYYDTLAKAYAKRKDRPGFESVMRRVKGYPRDKQVEPYRNLLAQLHSFAPELARELMEKELADQSLTPVQRAAFLTTKQDLYRPLAFNYGFNEPGIYRVFREVVRERISLLGALAADPQGTRKYNILEDPHFFHRLDLLVAFDDIDLAERLLDLKLEKDPGSPEGLRRKARLRGIRNDAKGAAAALRAALASPKCTAAVSNDVLPLLPVLEGRGIAAIAVPGLAPGQEASPAARLKTLRQVSRELFQMRRYDDCRAIFEETHAKLLRPQGRTVCRVDFLADGPRSAEGFVRTPLYDDWDAMMTSFKVFGDYLSFSGKIDEQRNLKDAVQPPVDPAYRTGIRATCDEEGVHVFIRCEDPAIREVKLGKRDAGTLELVFRPGGPERAYHSVFFTGLPRTEDPHQGDWAMPGRHYRRTADAFRKDAVLTKSGCVAHLLIPWMSFYDSLPIDGNEWILGLVRWTQKDGLSTGGVVHDLSRAMALRFSMTPQQLAELKRNVALSAFNRYDGIRRDEGDFLLTWKDPLLGDPVFFEKIVEPLVARLDAAGEKLLAPATDAEVAELFRDVVPLWAEIGYEIAEERERYLNDRLFEDE